VFCAISAKAQDEGGHADAWKYLLFALACGPVGWFGYTLWIGGKIAKKIDIDKVSIWICKPKTPKK